MTNVIQADTRSASEREKLHSLSVVAERLSVSIWTIRKWVQTGQLASVRLGARRLISESEMQRAMNEGLR